MRGRIFFATLISFALALSFMACEGDQGPQGPVGPQGVEGPEGPSGQDGQNGAENCIDCHGSNQLITAKMFQWENSVHALGGHYVRNGASCAACHTSQGFLDRIATGDMSASMDTEDPLPQNCYTCHQVHNTYTAADWALTQKDPVTFWQGGETVDLGNSNLCISCHQARVADVPDIGDTGMLTVTSSRYGPHHGAQGMMFTGSGAYEIPGALNYENSFHTPTIANACVSCHMAEIFNGRDAGGHTFRVATADAEGIDFDDPDRAKEVNINGCTQCHMNEAELRTLITDTQTEVADLLHQLGTRLNELGILRDNLESVNAPIELTSEQVGILWNYQYVREDQSMGVHNYKYAKALLQNSLDALN